MNAQFLSPADPRWRRLLDRVRHDVYHLPEYSAVSGHYEGGEPLAFYAEEGDHALLIPLLVRQLPADLGASAEGLDATSAYGYSGPIATPAVPLAVMRSALARFREISRERGLVSAFIRLHPLRSAPIIALGEAGTLVNHGPIVYVDLAKSIDELWAETRSNHRRNIGRLIRMGYVVDVDDWTTYSAFRLLYRTTMQRRSAREFYFFSDDYFDELREHLGDRLHLFTVRGPSGDIAAAGLFTLVDGIAEYHLGGTEESHLANAPSKLMFHFVRRWAKEGGASVLNLGGGVGASAGPLQQFKTGFSQTQTDFHSLRVVFDEERYGILASENRQLHQIGDGVADDFFPAYRQPYCYRDQHVSEPA